MSKTSANQFRQERANELEQLARMLNGQRMVRGSRGPVFCPDVRPLYNAAGRCRNLKGNSWGYSIERLIFRLGGVGRTVPAAVTDMNLIFSLNIAGACDAENTVCDPFDTFSFNIVLEGNYKRDGKTNKTDSSWHLDRDEAAEGDGTQEFIHPCYHFQYGGMHMWKSSLDYKDALILETPRIAHPPMDAILGIDFILTNYFSSSIISFRSEPGYLKTLKEAQSRFWRPYAQSLALAWPQNDIVSSWNPTRIWPQLHLGR